MINISHCYDLREIEKSSTSEITKEIIEFCFKNSFNIVFVRSIMSNTSYRRRLATVKTFNLVHANEHDHIIVDKYQHILLNQDMRVKNQRDIFDDLNIYIILKKWKLSVSDETRSALKYFRRLSNELEIVKSS